MTLLDIILAIPLGIFIFLGWKRGVVREAATLMGVLVGIWAAVHFSRLIASLLGLTGDHAILIAFFILFVGTMVLAFLLGRIAERVIKSLKMNLPNKIAGAALGMVKALCILAVLLNGIIMLDRHAKLISQETREESVLYAPVYSTGNELISSLKEFIEEHPDLPEKITKTGDKAAEKVNEKSVKIKEKSSTAEKKKENKKGGRK
jgi:membrane protein required for colicin V production